MKKLSSIACALCLILLLAGCGDDGGGGEGGGGGSGTTPVSITTTSLPVGNDGIAYSATIATTGGGGSGYTWSVVSGSLPPGLALNDGTPDATLTGTPTAPGVYNFTVEVQDPATSAATQALTLAINGSPPVPFAITNTFLPDGKDGVQYLEVVSATGGAGGFIWSIVSGSLPPGLVTVNGTPNGNISGTPTLSGNFSFTLQVEDSASNTATMPLTLFIETSLAISTTTMPPGMDQTAYSQTVSASGGTASGYAWSVIAGALPAGLNLTNGTPDATLSGTPTVTGAFNFTVQVQDSGSNTATQAISMTVYDTLRITTTSLPSGTQGVGYAANVDATAGSASGYTWSITNNTLPMGLALSGGTPTASIIGNPSVATTWNFTVQVQDSVGFTASANLGITIDPGVLSIISPATLPYAVDTFEYHYEFMAAGGAGGYVWQKLADTLPAGITFETVGGLAALHGTPTVTGNFSVTVQVTDASTSVQKTCSLEVRAANGVLSITTVTIGNWLNGEAVDDELRATGGSGTGYTWALASGSALPGGISIQNGATPSLSGPPSVAGTYTFTLEVTDSGSNLAAREFTVEVMMAAPTFYGQVVTDKSLFVCATNISMFGSRIANLRSQLHNVIRKLPSSWQLDLMPFSTGFAPQWDQCFGILQKATPFSRWQALQYIYGASFLPAGSNSMYQALQKVSQAYPTTLQSMFVITANMPMSASSILADSPGWFGPFTGLQWHCFAMGGTASTFMQQLAALHGGSYTGI